MIIKKAAVAVRIKIRAIIIKRFFFGFAFSIAVFKWVFDLFRSISAQVNSVAKIASPAIISGIPGPGRTKKTIPKPSKVIPRIAVTNHLIGWGNFRQLCKMRSYFTP